MSKIIVVPGDLVSADRKRLGSHVFIENGKIYSDTIGILQPEDASASVIPLHGKYMPVSDDLVIGIIVSETFSGYRVDINSFYFSYVSKEEFREKLKRGSIISSKIVGVNEINEASLGSVKVFYGGEIVSVSPVKVPRVIGRNASMIDVLRKGTGCNIMVGRNGRIWVKDGNLELFKAAIEKIEGESHLSNLTNKIDSFLKEKKGEK